jgi:acyl carrier protein
MGRFSSSPGRGTSIAVQAADLKRQITQEIKQLLVSELNLAGKTADAIDEDASLFGTGGLGLDSLDALQIAMLIEEKFGVRVPEGDEARPIFKSVSTLAEFVEKEQSK